MLHFGAVSCCLFILINLNLMQSPLLLCFYVRHSAFRKCIKHLEFSFFMEFLIRYLFLHQNTIVNHMIGEVNSGKMSKQAVNPAHSHCLLHAEAGSLTVKVC